MQGFDYQTPTRLIFGKGVVEKLPEVMAGFGKKILLTYGGGSIKKIGLYDKVKELLKDFEIFELSIGETDKLAQVLDPVVGKGVSSTSGKTELLDWEKKASVVFFSIATRHWRVFDLGRASKSLVFTIR